MKQSLSAPQEPASTDARPVVLRDGTRAVIRPIRRDGGPSLAEHLRRLSPESRYQRFFSAKSELADEELEFFTHPDGVNHLALVLAVTGEQGNEQDSVAVARCVRERSGATVAEVAIAVMDEWQGRGIGRLLLGALAAEAYRVGIRYWCGSFLAENTAVRKIMDVVGTRESEEYQGHGIVQVVYRLHPPAR